jgi:hypothetical protein
MKPIRHTKTARLRGLKMYREDMDGLIRLFQKCASLTISDNKNNYESLDEMKQTIGLKIVNLDIRGEKPGVHFLSNQKAYQPGASTPAVFNELRTEETTDAADDLFREIKEFLEKYQRPGPARFLIPAIICLLSFSVTVAYALAKETPDYYRIRWVAGAIGCTLFAALLALLGIANSQNYLLLEKKINSPTFFAKNREEFAICESKPSKWTRTHMLFTTY